MGGYFKDCPLNCITETEIGDAETDGFWGDWGPAVFCPDDEFVYGYRLRSESHQGSNDDTALNNIELRCSPNGRNQFSTISSAHMSWGLWTPFKYCVGEDNPVTGFNMKMEGPQGDGDDTAANKVDLYCKKGGYISVKTKTSWGHWTNKKTCPTGSAVMGIKTKVEGSQGSQDDTALNGVRLYCRPY